MTVFYLLAVDLPSWVLGIDDRSLTCCVQSAFSDTHDQNARVRKRFVPCFVSVIASRLRDFARVTV